MKRIWRTFMKIFITLLLLCSPVALKAQTKVVTTYIVQTQDEREKTRFTLTEWLRIKERMKLMDTWLALFSDPQKDKFSLEINFSYKMGRGEKVFANEGIANKYQSQKQHIASQLWLTNILTSTTKTRALNIDFGVEGNLLLEKNSLDPQVDPKVENRSYLRWFTGNFRIFGKNIQDTSLVLKAGQYNYSNNYTDILSTEQRKEGLLWGADFYLYLLRFLGGEAEFQSFGKKSLGDKQGQQLYYGGFIEVALLRLTGGVMIEEWNYQNLDLPKTKATSKTIMFGGKLQF